MKEYKFKGLPITPAMMEIIIVELFNGQTIKRDIIVNKVLEHHLINGGLSPDAQDFPRSVKKALSNLQDKGIASNKAYGFWTIINDHEPKAVVVELEENEIDIEDIPTHAIYGKGNFSIYLYYFPSYKTLAEMQNKIFWPCKIGRTDRDPLIRILSQASTALPEKPLIEFIIKTDNSSLLENMIHSVLTIRNKHIKFSPGNEWFETNPQEVLEIIKYVNKEIL